MQREGSLRNGSGWVGIANVQSDPTTLRKLHKVDQLTEHKSDQQRPIVPNVKAAVIVSGRRPGVGIQPHIQHNNLRNLRNLHNLRNDAIHHYPHNVPLIPPSATESKSFKQFQHDKVLEKIRCTRNAPAKEELVRKAEEARRLALQQIQTAKKSTQFPLSPTAKKSTQFPLFPEEVKLHHRRELTEFELQEVQKYKEIWYLGLGRQRRKPTKTKQSRDDTDDGMYAAEAHDHLAYRYEIVGLLGRGSFGQVFKCRDHKNNTDVAIKILRNKKKFYRQGIVEVRLLDHLRKKEGQNGENGKNVIRMEDCFHFRKHICIVLELAGINLYDLLKRNAFNGFSLMAVKRFAWNILQALAFLQQEKIIHCDIKPENILLRARQGTPGSSIYDIKVTDFGSGCFVQEQIYCYIQSRYYRAPEIILGFTYDCGIDVWSFGCVLAELLLGKPIFPGENEGDQLSCIVEVLGVPPNRIVQAAPRARYFFDSAGEPTRTTNSRGKKRLPGTKPLQTVLKTCDRRFLEFMKRCLEWDPRVRITAEQLLAHEWIVGPGKSARDYPCFTNHTPKSDILQGRCLRSTGKSDRDFVAELLTTNPFNDENKSGKPADFSEENFRKPADSDTPEDNSRKPADFPEDEFYE